MSNNSQTSTADQFGVATFIVTEPGVYQFISTKNQLYSETKSTIVTGSKSIDVNVNFVKLTLTTNENADITISDGVTTITGIGTGNVDSFLLPNLGDWHVEASSNGIITKTDIHATEYRTYVRDITQSIYGAYWNGSSNQTWTRMDDASSFIDPIPYLGDGEHPGSSPFDILYPWSDMRVHTINGDTFVSVPAYWYKITRDDSSKSIYIQIANYAADGFSLSPAHQDRGDGVGERDVVYIARYKTSYHEGVVQSIPMIRPTIYGTSGNPTSLTQLRSDIQAKGPGYHSEDYALYWTIRMLYLVEFANWNAQLKIGYGGYWTNGYNRYIVFTGNTDNMPYHTGFIESDKTKYSAGLQYRYIEDMWSNGYEFIDGIYRSSTSVYVSLQPNYYTTRTTTYYTLIGTITSSSGYYAKTALIPTVQSFDWAMCPATSQGQSGSTTSYIGETIMSSSGTYLASGSNYNLGNSLGRGLFSTFFDLSEKPSSSYCLTSRMQYLPQNS